MSVDNDEYLCSLAIPSLTSIDVNPQQIGYEAAAVLDRMMAGKPAPHWPVMITPRGVVTRQSTDVLATEDQKVVQAVAFIASTPAGGSGWTTCWGTCNCRGRRWSHG